MCGIYFLMQKIVQENKNNMQNNYEKTRLQKDKILYCAKKLFIFFFLEWLLQDVKMTKK